MVNLRFVAFILGTNILIIIGFNLLKIAGLESSILLLEAGLIAAWILLFLILSSRKNTYSSGGQIQVPPLHENKLEQEEELVSRLTGQQDVDWYLTNKHLIRLQKNDILKMTKKPIWFLPIKGLTFQYKSRTPSRKMASWCLGALLLGIGVLMITIGYLCSINSTYSSIFGVPQSIALLVGATGYLFLFFAVIPPAINFSFYQFLHLNLEGAGDEKKLWRLRETSKNKETLKQFLADLERYSQNA